MSRAAVSTLLAVLPVLCGAAPAQGLNPSPEQLYQVITEQRDRLRSMQGKISVESIPDATAEAAQEMRGRVPKLKVTFAWSGEKRLLIDEGEYIGSDMKRDAMDSTNVWDGKEFRRREGRGFLIQKVKSTYAEANPYLHVLRWPMTGGERTESREAPEETSFLPSCLQSKGCRVRPGQDVADGVACVVVEKPGRGWRYWFDPSRGYCLVRAELDRPTHGYIRSVSTYKNFREVLPGVYLPLEVVTVCDLENGGKPTGTLTTRIVVHDLQVNKVPDTVFTLEPDIGDYVMDTVRNQTYRYTRQDNKTLDVVSRQAAQVVGSTKRTNVIYFMTAFLVALVLGAAAVYGAARALRSFRGRDRAG